MPSTVLAAYRALVQRGELKQDAAQLRTAERLDVLARTLKSYRPGRRRGLFGLGGVQATPRGLYVWGAVGRGKSMLMDLFFETVRYAPKKRVHFHAFMLDAHARVKRWRDKDPGDPLPKVARDLAREASLLCFDEFQVTDIADAMILGRLFGALFDHGVVIVATSNRAPDALYTDGINRQLFLPAIAMLKGRLETVELAGPLDYRLEHMKGMPVYLTPLGPKATAALDESWSRLTDNARPVPHEFTVQGRILSVPRSAKGVARFSFAELCERPLGAADYLEIARRYHTLVLDGVPSMGPDKRNEARRFATLVDALYEAKTKLIAAAAGPPAALYPKGDGAFEFERTESRLIEMQSADYLALPHIS